MASDIKPGQTVRVTIKTTVNREGARKTLERLFMTDKATRAPLDLRSSHFRDKPKRRGGCIWTKRPNKLHLPLNKGDGATIKVTPQGVKDLGSVSSFVEIVGA